MESLRQFLRPGASAREFAQPYASANVAIHQFRRGLSTTALKKVRYLFSGSTSEAEEDQALAMILGADYADEIIFLINSLSWQTLIDELDEPDLDQIAVKLSRSLDRRDYRVRAILKRTLLSEAEALQSKSTNELIAISATIPFEIRQEVADEIVSNRDRFLDGVAVMALRGLPTSVREFKLLIDFIQATGQHRPAELSQIGWEVFYTERICSQLARAEVRLLFLTLPELLDLNQPQVRRIAHFEMLTRWEREFVAFEQLVKVLGNERQKTDVRKFMETRRLFLDNFPPAPQQPSAIQQALQTIASALNSVADGFHDVADAVRAIAQAIDELSLSKLAGTASDAEAVDATNSLFGRDLLAPVTFDSKLQLINNLLDGAAEDEEEQAILKILQESRKRSVPEFMQLVAGATMEKLLNSFDGQEGDDLVGLFTF